MPASIAPPNPVQVSDSISIGSKWKTSSNLTFPLNILVSSPAETITSLLAYNAPIVPIVEVVLRLPLGCPKLSTVFLINSV